MSSLYQNCAHQTLQQQKIVDLFLPLWAANSLNRQQAAYMLSGVLLRAAWPVAEAKGLIRSICQEAKDTAVEAKLKAVDIANEKLKKDKPVPGWPKFRKTFGHDIAAQLEVYLQPEGLPEINAGIQDLPTISRLAWQALEKANQPPRFFRYGNIPSRLENDDDGTPILRELTASRLKHELARSARWYIEETDRSGNTNRRDSRPPDAVVQDMLAYAAPPLPLLYSISETPVFAPDGSLQTEPGYHEASRSYYAPGGDFVAPHVLEKPTANDITQAVRIIDELLSDFPFVSEADRAHAVALFILPPARNLIDGPTPNHLFEAPCPGSGKTLLAEVLLHTSIGRGVGMLTQARDDDEYRKRLTALFREGHPVILLDNLTKPLDSGVIASALTALKWQDRVLGQSTTISLPVRSVWITTANNPTMSMEIARRSIRIRLDPSVDRPWLREGFKHADLRGWARENRGELVWAALTLIRSWIAAGRPACQSKPLGSYEKWSSVIGGILEHAGISGFLSKLDEFYEASDFEADVWRAFIPDWWERFGPKDVTVSDLFPLAIECEEFDFDGSNGRAQKISFGKQLARQRDRVIGGFRVLLAGKVQRAAKWKLVPLHQTE